MLNQQQTRYRERFLSPIRQKLYFAKNLPMGFISGIKQIRLDEKQSISSVSFHWWNKNPFRSMYFAVMSMAAELSTAAPAMMAMKGYDADIALIIVGLKAEFVKKAQSEIAFTCEDYNKFKDAIARLQQADDISTVTAKTVGRDTDGIEVATFYFTWSFKRRS